MKNDKSSRSTNRKNTDKSLKTERAKIDDYLDTKNSELETNISNPLFNKRVDADNELDKTRSRNDATINEKPKEIKKVLTQERKKSDEAKIEARIFEDQLVDRKITENNLQINAFLDVDRKDTDSKLLDERNDNDLKTNQHILSYDKISNDLSTRDQYLATVSHDLKNPLNAIALSTGAMKRSFFKGNVIKEEAFLNYFELIERNVETMKRLINDLLDVEQMVNGAIMLNLKKCNISELLKEVQFSFGPAILNQNLSLELQPVDETIVAVIDYDRIFQVLSNLIGNAIKFSSRNGVIKIGFEKIDNMISISIHDNGPGIPEDKKDLIFERFTQLNTNDHRGKGLGLFISKWIVESHEGEIFVESSKDKGSTFKITLPILQESTSHLIN